MKRLGKVGKLEWMYHARPGNPMALVFYRETWKDATFAKGRRMHW